MDFHRNKEGEDYKKFLMIGTWHEKINKFCSEARVSIADDNEVFISAIINNRPDIVSHYLNQSNFNPSKDDNLALRLAAEKGFTEIIKLLLVKGVSWEDALRYAHENQLIKQYEALKNLKLI